MRQFVFAAALVIAGAGLPSVLPTPARADANLPFCASGGGQGGGGPSIRCDYATFEQCQQTVRGSGGSCSGNLSYDSSFNQARQGRIRR